MLTGVLSELFEARDVDDVGGQARVTLAQGDGGDSRACAPMMMETLLDEAADLAAVGPPRARIILPFPHRRHALRLAARSGRGRRQRRAAPRAAHAGGKTGSGGHSSHRCCVETNARAGAKLANLGFFVVVFPQSELTAVTLANRAHLRTWKCLVSE